MILIWNPLVLAVYPRPVIAKDFGRNQRLLCGRKLQRRIHDLVLGEDGVGKSLGFTLGELLVCQAA